MHFIQNVRFFSETSLIDRQSNLSTSYMRVCLPGEINGRDSGSAGMRAAGWAPEQPTHSVRTT